MKILYLITELGLGGAEVLLVNLANKMIERGHRVEILVLGAINAHRQNLDAKVRVHIVDMKKDVSGLLKAYRACWELARETQWDVVHAHMFHANIVARLAGPLFKNARVISTAHSNNEGGAARMLAYRLTDFLSDINTNVSQGALARYVSHRFFSRSKSICVYNFVDTERYRADPAVRQRMRMQNNIQDDKFVILNVGRLVPEKNQALLLHAFALVLEDRPHARLLIVGEGPEREALEHQAAELGIEGFVRFCGSQRNTVEWYNAADLFVLTSRIEGFGLVLAEAMASGCPTITTDVGGCGEVVGDVGTLVPPDSAGILAEAIRRHIDMSVEQRAFLSEKQCERIVRLFDTVKVEAEWQKLYAEGLG